MRRPGHPGCTVAGGRRQADRGRAAGPRGVPSDDATSRALVTEIGTITNQLASISNGMARSPTL